MGELRTLMDTAERPAHGVSVERKSEFLADACHIDSLQDALDFIAATHERHPKARHVAYAAMVGGYDGAMAERMSDDGEPSGTAGKPILDTMRANSLTDCVVSVTRYFGGILLGSGGLIRQYAGACMAAIDHARLAQLVECQEYRVTLDYRQFDHAREITAVCGGSVLSTEYTNRVALTVELPVTACADFEHRVREAFSATVVPVRTSQRWRAVAQGTAAPQ